MYSIPDDDVKQAMGSGYTFVCSMCVHLHRAQGRVAGRVLEWSAQCGQVGCGGPGAGLAYPKYQGPLGDNLAAHCCYCGSEDADYAATVASSPGRFVAVCQDHLKYLGKDYVPKGQTLAAGPAEVRTAR